MAATAAVLGLLSAGDHVVVSDDLYGGTYRLFSRVLERYGLQFTYVDMTRPRRGRAPRCGRNTKLFWIETPTNPLLKLVDIAARRRACAAARSSVVAVDNTFATPYFQQPLALGAHDRRPLDDEVHRRPQRRRRRRRDHRRSQRCTSRLRFSRMPSAAFPGRTTRGSRCAAPRRSRCACASTRATRRPSPSFSESRDDVARVYYPGLPSHPQHELAKRQMSGFGGMVSFVLDGPPRARARFRAAV